MKKAMIRGLFLLMATAFAWPSTAQDKKKDNEVIVIHTTLNCNNCVKKVENSLPFEKGVKDIKIDFDNQQVTVNYDASKTDTTKLLKAFEKIKIPAEVK